MRVCGIDVGKTGGFAWVEGVDVAWARAQPLVGSLLNEVDMAAMLRASAPHHCFIERAQAMPAQGRVSIMNYGIHFGLWRMACVALDIPYTVVSPNKWKRVMGVTADKATSILMAQRLFPKVSLLPTDKCRKPSDGMAEALLIAEYGRRVLAGKETNG